MAESLGLRLHESFSLRRSQIRKALQDNYIEIKGKGGLVRAIPITNENKLLLTAIINSRTTKEDRIFVKNNEKTHKEMKKFQAFIRNTRKPGVTSTYHSLRHKYAQNLYSTLITSGLTDMKARKIVSNRLGHNRIEITDVYLSK